MLTFSWCLSCLPFRRLTACNLLLSAWFSDRGQFLCLFHVSSLYIHYHELPWRKILGTYLTNASSVMLSRVKCQVCGSIRKHEEPFYPYFFFSALQLNESIKGFQIMWNNQSWSYVFLSWDEQYQVALSQGKNTIKSFRVTGRAACMLLAKDSKISFSALLSFLLNVGQ